jgi:autotransporter-associated beta strand protein
VPNEFVDAAFFGKNTVTSVSIASSIDVGEWLFDPQAMQYNFIINGSLVTFSGGGIAGSPSISLGSGGSLTLYNYATLGKASITNAGGGMDLWDFSTLGTSNIENFRIILFLNDSSAGSSMIHTLASGGLSFRTFSNGGTARLNTDAGATVDFSHSAGPAGNHQLSIGSIEGAGTYELGPNQLTVGISGLSKIVSGLIDDGGLHGSLKVGHGKLTLSHAGNTYLGGTTIEQGTLELAAVGAAGSGDIDFSGKANATLAIENAALTGHVFSTNKIGFFGRHDFLDLAGLRFHSGATAKYHPATEVLAVHSGHATDKLTLVSPHGTHFEAASDHNGGTDVFLLFA